MKQKSEVEIVNRKSAFAELKQFDFLAEEHEFIEVTEWTNGEGYDVTIKSSVGAHFQITIGEFKAMKKLIKYIEKSYDE